MTQKQSSREVVLRLQGLIADSLSRFFDKRPFALLDFPDHSNVGDSAIFMGELAFFKALNVSPAYMCVHDKVDWKRLERCVPDGPLFIHGGGNFGDIWPVHQKFRLEVLRRFPKRQIIQLPQSIHFDNEDAIRETSEAIALHGNFVLTVRDLPSFEFAKQRFDCEVILCPDMAFYLGPQSRPKEPVYDEVYILRTDKEQVAAGRPAIEGNAMVTDWLQGSKILHRKLRVQRALARELGRLTFDEMRFQDMYCKSAARQRVNKGYRLLSAGKHVTSDRLHVHILSTLLDIPHTVLDNSYGKIHRFMEAWDTAWSGVTDSHAEGG